MGEEHVGGIEARVFGAVGRTYVDAWVAAYAEDRLGCGVERCLFRAGRLVAVYALCLRDSRSVVVKVHEGEADVDRLSLIAELKLSLVRSGYPCPRPLDGPEVRDGRTVLVEELLGDGERADGHAPLIRRAMAQSLATHVARLAPFVPVAHVLAAAPSWIRFEDGTWPTPHDPGLDFSAERYEWLDTLASAAAEVLGARREPDAVGHGDWECQNLRFSDGAIAAVFDMESLLAHEEAVLAGLSAGIHTAGGIAAGDAPTPAEAASFLRYYERARGRDLSAEQRRRAGAAAMWVVAYNARCDAAAPGGWLPGEGSFLRAARSHGLEYLDLARY